MFKSKSVVFSAICCGFLVASATVFAASADKEAAAKSSDLHEHTKSSGSSHHDQCSQKMSMIDQNKDGKISKDEFLKRYEDKFTALDANKDGFLDESEMHRMMDKMHSKKDKGGHGHHNDSGHTHSDSDKTKSQ